MKFQDIEDSQKLQFNNAVSHPLQSFEWGEFRKKTGVKAIRRGQVSKKGIENAYQLTIHNAPFGFKIGYLPKGDLPNKDLLDDLQTIGKQEKLIYIQLEPSVEKTTNYKLQTTNLKKSFHPLFTKYSFILDLDRSEEELLSGMHPKTRYNIKVAAKHGVEIKEENSDNAFYTYLKLTEETTQRQKFYAHDEDYHRKMWQTLKLQATNYKLQTDRLTAHLFTAKYKGKIITAWIVFVFKDALYYPYGASSKDYPEVMANNLMAWEIIKYGKESGLKKFDMWGALSENPNPNDPWFGFHRFKKGYGAKLVEFVGSYDLVINPGIYQLAKIADKARWIYLGIKSTTR